MQQLNKPTMIRIDVTCPFCLESTEKWKMFLVIWRRRITKHGHVRNVRIEPWEVKNAQQIKEFEYAALKQHVSQCNVMGVCQDASKVLALYSL